MDMGFYLNKIQFVSQTYIYSHNCQRTLEGWYTLFSGLHKWRYLHTINDNQDNNYFNRLVLILCLLEPLNRFFPPFPSHTKTCSFSELTLRNPTFLKSKSTNTSIRKFTVCLKMIYNLWYLASGQKLPKTLKHTSGPTTTITANKVLHRASQQDLASLLSAWSTSKSQEGVRYEHKTPPEHKCFSGILSRKWPRLNFFCIART